MTSALFQNIVDHIREQFGTAGPIPLHAPVFPGNEKAYLNECIDSTFVTEIGPFVARFEEAVARYAGCAKAVAVVNGTAALHLGLLTVGVEPGCEVLTQSLTFVATANAIAHCGARPVFLDVDRGTLGLCPKGLDRFLDKSAEAGADGRPVNRRTRRRIAACVPVHTFGHPARIDEIVAVCDRWSIPVVEDAAEALGSFFKGRHAGTFGRLGVLSFNGNKTATAGGAGMILTDDDGLAAEAKHVGSTAKLPHRWEYVHDRVGFNYRLSNLHAAVGRAQMESIDRFLENKRELALAYAEFFDGIAVPFVAEPAECRSNYWLNAILLPDRDARDAFLAYSNDRQVASRPAWRPLNELEMYSGCETGDLSVAAALADRLINIPSGVRL